MGEDPIVAEIRRIRQEYAARFNHDRWLMLPAGQLLPLTPAARQRT